MSMVKEKFDITFCTMFFTRINLALVTWIKYTTENRKLNVFCFNLSSGELCQGFSHDQHVVQIRYLHNHLIKKVTLFFPWHTIKQQLFTQK